MSLIAQVCQEARSLHFYQACLQMLVQVVYGPYFGKLLQRLVSHCHVSVGYLVIQESIAPGCLGILCDVGKTSSPTPKASRPNGDLYIFCSGLVSKLWPKSLKNMRAGPNGLKAQDFSSMPCILTDALQRRNPPNKGGPSCPGAAVLVSEALGYRTALVDSCPFFALSHFQTGNRERKKNRFLWCFIGIIF